MTRTDLSSVPDAELIAEVQRRAEAATRLRELLDNVRPSEPMSLPPGTRYTDLDFQAWKAALEAVNGNITRACENCGVDRKTGTNRTKAMGLVAYAARLRLEAGGTGRGRPKNSSKR